MKIFTVQYWKELLVEKFAKSYLKGFIDRLKGYTFFSSLLLTALQVAAVLVTNSDAGSVIQILIAAFGDTVTGVAQPNEVTMVATSLGAIWGLIKKLYKLYKGVPQVPTIVITKAK